MILKEKLEVLVYRHPYFESLNQKLMSEFKLLTYSNSYKTNVKAIMSEWDIEFPSLHLLNQWVVSLISNSIPGYGYTYTVLDRWVSWYKKGDYTIKHRHVPAPFSYVYFVKTPRGSSPLIFTHSRKRIKAEEGKLIIFPGCVEHHVPKNRCDDRIVVAGNVFATDRSDLEKPLMSK
tara:strand:+ start:64 stop:591 length:528 start_codon:yes stop_codon:yes gene_type:complete